MNKVTIIEIDEENYEIYINDQFLSEISGAEYGRSGVFEAKELLVSVSEKLGAKVEIKNKY